MVRAPLANQLQAALGLKAASADHQVLRATKSRHNYRRYLERALGFERGLDVMLTNFTFDWDITSRSKLLLLSSDLLALGASIEEILALPTCTAVQRVRDPLEAHCWLFVVERVSNAHWAAYHELDAVTRELAASFLRAMLARQGWEQVCGAFDRFSADEQVFEQLVASTDAAMREHYDWFAEQGCADKLRSAREEHAHGESFGRLARGTGSLCQPPERDAVPIVPAPKRVDDAPDAPAAMESASDRSTAKEPPDDVVE